MFPWISPQGQLFFASNGLTGLGGLDIFVAELDENGKIRAVQHGGPVINTQWDDFGLAFLPDGKSGYVSSNREGGFGGDDIYSFNLIRPFVFKTLLSGQITDLNTGSPLPNGTVTLLDEEGNVLGTDEADADGAYSFEVEPGKNYKLVFNNAGYDTQDKTLSVPENASSIISNGELSRTPTFGLMCLVTDAANSQPLDNVAVIIKDIKTGKILLSSSTPASGSVITSLDNVKLGDNLNLEITLTRDGYLSKSQTLNLGITKPGMINLHELMDVQLSKVEVGIDLATIIDIKPIYFDLGKATIRKDAAIELDKIVKVMNDYPNMEIELGSHTDCRGSMASNTALSVKSLIILIFFHGLRSPVLFILVGILYSYYSSRQLVVTRGLLLLSPLLSFILILAFFFTMSAPPFPSFVAEVLFFISSYLLSSYLLYFVLLFTFFSLVYNLLWFRIYKI